MFNLLNMADKNIKLITAINRLIRNMFGCTADVVAAVWNLLKVLIYQNVQKITHLLCLLAYMQSYQNF
jgi:hypothetical protein